VWCNFLPPHQRFALLVHLPQLVLPVSNLAHVHLHVLCFCKELLHVITDTVGWGVITIAPLLNIPAIALPVIVLVMVLLLVMLLVGLLLLLVTHALLWTVLPPMLLLVTVLG
jgi:hypothetical protein